MFTVSDLRDRLIKAIASTNTLVYLGEWQKVADAVIAELDADYILVPKGHTIVRWRSPDYFPGKCKPEVTPWKDHYGR